MAKSEEMKAAEAAAKLAVEAAEKKATEDAAAEAAAKKQGDDEAAAKLAVEATEKNAAKKGPKLIKVRPTKAYMWEPFQMIAIQEGVETPVEKTSWVTSQIEVGLLEEC